MKRTLKAVIVEDNADVSQMMADALDGASDISAQQVHDLPDAVSLCRRSPQMVLLVDLGLPSASGADAVSILRREAPEATLVVVTGRSELSEDAKKCGAHRVIIKGSDESYGDGLVKAVREAVIAHDVELLFAPAAKAAAKTERTINVMSDSVTAKMLEANYAAKAK